jgi:FdhD protein
MEHIDSIRLSSSARLTQTSIRTVLESVRKHESIYKLAGAVHGCALFSNPADGGPALLQFVEDVGRHNAVDAIAGRMWADGTVGSDKIFYTTGRLTSEMVMKCAQMGIPILLSRSGLTGLGHEIAQRVGITLVGRCQGRHYLVFTGADRVIAPGMALPDA